MTNITFIFETSPNTKPKEKKWGDMAYYVPPSEKVSGTRPTCPPANCAHVRIKFFKNCFLDCITQTLLIVLDKLEEVLLHDSR